MTQFFEKENSYKKDEIVYVYFTFLIT